MTDLLVGVALIVALSAAVFGTCITCAAKLNGKTFLAVASAVLTASMLFAWLLHGNLILTKLVPFSNAIFVGNWIPVGLAAIAGLIVGRDSIRLWRRSLLAGCLFLLAGYALLRPLLANPPPPRSTYVNKGVFQQSNKSSCSAAAATTLLQFHNIDANESEMMRLCLTGRKGTPDLGLYRGLKIKTRSTLLQVTTLESSVEELLSADQWPVLLFVHLDRDANVDPRYELEWGWTPGLRHTVVVFGRLGEDRLDVGDPSIGREEWTLDDLRVLWHGEGLRLTSR